MKVWVLLEFVDEDDVRPLGVYTTMDAAVREETRARTSQQFGYAWTVECELDKPVEVRGG